MNPVNFGIYTRRDVRESNYRLGSEPVKLTAKIIQVFDAPGVDTWEGEGGACMPAPFEEEIEVRNKSKMNLRGSRKQRAAKQFIPRESIKVVEIKTVVPKQVAMAIVQGKSDHEIKVAELEAKIQTLLGIVNKPKIEAQRKAESINKLEQVFAARRLK